MKQIIVIGICIGCLLSACTFTRTVIWNFADQKDIERFDSNEIAGANGSFQFVRLSEWLDLRVDDPLGNNLWKAQSLDDLLDHQKAHEAFVVIKKDTIVYEHFGEGVDMTTPLTIYSGAKSVLSILVGMALEDGFIKDLNDPITDYVPQLKANDGFGNIRLAHLLKHTSGIRYKESYTNPFKNDVIKLYYGKSVDKLIRRLKVEEAPGKRYRYSSLNSQLLGLALHNALGEQSISEFLSKKLWQPLGNTTSSWNIYENEKVEKTFCCLNATVYDFARFGRFMSHGGKWADEQLVDKSWIDASLERSIEDGSIWRYQYHWRIGLERYGDFMAQGLYAQYIYVMPEKEVIIVSIHDFHRPNKNWPRIFRQIVDQL